MKVLTHAPADLVIGTSDGVDVRFAGVQLKDTPGDLGGATARRAGIHLFLSGVRGEETMSRDVLFERDAMSGRNGARLRERIQPRTRR